jgi:hypothetical protein
MATESEHRNQAQHNGALLAVLDRNRFPDWIVTVAFYQAVHLVEMVFAHDIRPAGGSHIARNQTLKRHYPDLWREYRPIYTLSRTARYWCFAISSTQVDYALERLRHVEQVVVTLTS